MADIKKKFGVRLFQVRTEKGMIQAELAEKANLSIDSISRIERGQRAPSLEALERIAAALRVDPTALLNFKGKELTALAEGHPEALDLWNLLRNKRREQIRKVYEIAKIVLS